MLGISRITVRHALRNLEEAGLPAARARPRHLRALRHRRRRRARPHQLHRRDEDPGAARPARACWKRAGWRPAQEIADALEIALGEPVVQLSRLRLGNGMPIGIQTSAPAGGARPRPLRGGRRVSSRSMRWLQRALRHQPGQGQGSIPGRPRRRCRCRAHPAERQAPRPSRSSASPTIVHGPFEFTLSTMRADRYEIRSVLYV